MIDTQEKGRLDQVRVAIELGEELLGTLSEDEKIELLIDMISWIHSPDYARAWLLKL